MFIPPCLQAYSRPRQTGSAARAKATVPAEPTLGTDLTPRRVTDPFGHNRAVSESAHRPASPGPGAMTGVRVLDAGHGVASAYCTKLLTDQGADVVVLEPPGGDGLRLWSASELTGPDRRAGCAC